MSLSKDTFTRRKGLVIPRKLWLRPDMTEKLLNGTQSIDTNKQFTLSDFCKRFLIYHFDLVPFSHLFSNSLCISIFGYGLPKVISFLGVSLLNPIKMCILPDKHVLIRGKELNTVLLFRN